MIILRMAIVLSVLSLGSAASSQAAASQNESGIRQTIELASGWRFKLGDQPTFDDSWETVSVPHNWNRMGGTSSRGSDYQSVYGPGWYRLQFTAPARIKDKRVWLQFDAASIVADVWLNEVHLGQHKGAFARFRFDATDALRSGENLLVVRADNSKAHGRGSPTAEVIPISGDWPMYGGLYRGVSLIVTDPVHVDMMDYGGPGIYARTTAVTAESATIEVSTRLKNDSKRTRPVRVVATVIDHEGKPVNSTESKASIAASKSAEVAQSLSVPRPHLWNGVVDPYLYQLRVTVQDQRGALLDEVKQPLGIRTMRIDPNEGFFLNGKHIRLHGVSRHQDLQGKGWALSREDHLRDMEMIRELGANTVRFAHYQHDDYAYQLADELGLVAWAEIPLVDRTAPAGVQDTTPAFAAHAEQQLRELIRQSYNHPSIAVWSIGNEVNLDAAKGRTVSNAGPLLKALHGVAKAEDPSRPTTLADCCGSVPSEARPGLDTVAGLTDVVGFNRYYGWYGGKVSDLSGELTRLHQMYPNQPISVSEYGAGGALTQHSDHPSGGPIHAFGRPHPEEFQSYWLEESWKQIEPLPFVWASWVWNMFDFSNDSRMEGDLMDTNDKGLVTFDRKTKKDAFYFFKANWSDDPLVYISGRRYPDRAYPITDVKVYSNAAEASLQVGARDLGAAKCSQGICLWRDVPLEKGVNQLTATAMFAGQPVSDRIQWRFTGEPGRYWIRAGNLVGASSESGARYGSDNFFSGGEGRDRDPPAASRGAYPGPKNPVTGASDQTPYESYREGRFSYHLPVPNGAYSVTLRFFEPVRDQKPGARVFDVSAEDRPALKAFDVAAQTGGAYRAIERQFPVVVSDGTLDLRFIPQAGAAIVSAIELELHGK